MFRVQGPKASVLSATPYISLKASTSSTILLPSPFSKLEY